MILIVDSDYLFVFVLCDYSIVCYVACMYCYCIIIVNMYCCFVCMLYNVATYI